MCIDKSRYGNATSWHFCCKHVWQHTLEWKWDSETAVYTSHINRFSVCSEAQTTQNNLSAHILSHLKLPCWPFLTLVGINIIAWIVHINRDPDNYADFSSCSAVMMWNKVNWEVRELDKFPQWRELIATFLTGLPCIWSKRRWRVWWLPGMSMKSSRLGWRGVKPGWIISALLVYAEEENTEGY